jgi:hypothetical protein
LAFCVVALSFTFVDPRGLIPLDGPDALGPAADHAFLLSLTGELRNHMPPTTPYVVDEPLHYHWFGLADLAAMSWQGGQELDVLLLRLGPRWAMVNSFLAFALLGARLAGTKVVGLVAMGLAVFVGSVNLLHGASTNLVDGTLLQVSWFGSPTQGVGQLFAMAVLLVMVGLVRREDAGPGPWILFAVLSVALMGSKATFLPVIGAGMLLVAVVELVRDRRLSRPTVVVGAALAAELAFAQVVLFGGASQGLSIAPGDDLRRLGSLLQVPAETGTLPLVAVTVALVFGWLAPLAGAGLLVLRPRAATGRPGPGDPASLVVVGMVVSAVALCLLLSQSGFSEFFFLRSGLPFGYLLVACGVGRLTEFLPIRSAFPSLLLAAGGGAAYVIVARQLTTAQVGTHEAATRALLVVGGAVVLGALAWALGFLWACRTRRSGAFALGLACLSIATLTMGATRTVLLAKSYADIGDAPSTSSTALPRPLPLGAVAASRYVRDHSDPDDLLATNAHCNRPDQSVCDIRAFWVSALAERRVLVEGWAFTATANALTAKLGQVPSYWDPDLLATNDALFTDPSPLTLAALTDRHPVRWLVVDNRFPVDLAGLRALLPVHRTFGQTVIFRVPAQTFHR